MTQKTTSKADMAEVATSVGGAVFASVIGGPVGAGIAGIAAAVPYLRKLLGPAEERRVEVVVQVAAAHVEELRAAGREVRSDDFFDAEEGRRSAADELVPVQKPLTV